GLCLGPPGPVRRADEGICADQPAGGVGFLGSPVRNPGDVALLVPARLLVGEVLPVRQGTQGGKTPGGPWQDGRKTSIRRCGEMERRKEDLVDYILDIRGEP